jgi:hypothetical protein
MAFTIRSKEIVKYRQEEKKTPLVRYQIDCDTPADLPTKINDGEEMAQGSIAWVISTGEFYGYTSTGSWVNQTTLEPALSASLLGTRRKTSLDISNGEVIK